MILVLTALLIVVSIHDLQELPPEPIIEIKKEEIVTYDANLLYLKLAEAIEQSKKAEKANTKEEDACINTGGVPAHQNESFWMETCEWPRREVVCANQY